ncbi:MAG TPA: amino acid adenylation domain-containing protein, partial [Thermoanaerobaculia bacterium]|nr:amino acid adenylation domain-containing protein [Thermoanaerobaculia bacterium]
ERVGAEDNFFELGGHSLVATRVISRLRDALGLEVPLRDLFEAPTVSGLAGRVEQALRAGEGVEMPAIERVPRDRPLPLSFAQQRLWFLDQLDPGSPAYNLPAAVRLSGWLSRPALAAALGEIVRRHESLRTTFGRVGPGEAVQRIAPAGPVVLPMVDLSGLPEPAREPEALRLANEEAQRPFDLERGPLLRVTLVATAATEHAVLLTLHHIVGDAWSTGLLVQELGSLYAALAAGRPSPLQELGLQYADFAHWQRQWLSGAVLERQLTWWRERLSGALTLELPVDRPRPAVRTARGASRDLRLPRELSEGLATLARQQGATPFMALLAGFQALLARYAGQPEVSVGTPIAGRNHLRTEGLIGFFVNTLVLRTELGDDPGFAALVGRVRETALGAYAHQDLPFEKLVEELAPQRDLSRTPLFQVMFSLQNAPVGSLELPGLTLGALPAEYRTAKFDLNLSLGEGSEGIAGSLAYSTDLFEATTAERLLRHLPALFEGAVVAPERPLRELSLLAGEERHQLLVEWNDTARESPGEGVCLHDLFREQAARMPDAMAVVFEEEQLTFGDLDRRSERLACRLRRLGVGPESRVALCAERSPEMVVGLLAILKAGGAYVPLDPAHPGERLATILDDLNPGHELPVLLIQQPLAERLPAGHAHQVLLGVEERAPEALPDDGRRAAPENAAYVIYTSGSTGKPKGVVVEHRQAVNYLRGLGRILGLSGHPSFAMVKPLAVDSCKTVVFPPLFSGGTLHLVSRERALDPRALADYFSRHHVDCMKIAPSHFLALEGVTGPETLLPRQWLCLGGEASRAEWTQALGRVGECRVLSHYGPTETTVGMLTWHVEAGFGTGPSLTTPLGRPIANARVFLLDRHLEPVPVGVPGEIYIGGDCVTRGYLGRPDLTAERYVPNLFARAGKAGERLYRTGDLARYLADGRVEFLGRIDHQVKIRGFRIELGEIAAELCRHPAVQDGLVTMWSEAAGPQQLVGYVVPRGEAPAAGELRLFLRDRLPEYMVPAAFVFLAALPRTGQGKVDRKALPPPVLEASSATAPRTPVEEILAGIFADVLRRDRVGIEDSFF